LPCALENLSQLRAGDELINQFNRSLSNGQREKFSRPAVGGVLAWSAIRSDRWV
jgi:hypothetical protein